MLVRALAVLLALVCHAAEQQFADLGELKLGSGEVAEGCRLGYRTYGNLNPEKSNAILWPTWFSGTTEDLDGMVGPGQVVDSSKYFVITVDALGNGVSCSPSTSETQRDGRFPRFTIGDMVESQHRLVTGVLGIRKLHAVLGISMGGMQTFEWIVRYPRMMNKAIPIVGTTRQTTMDLLLWRAELGIIEAAQACNCNRSEAMKNVGLIHLFALETPEYRVRETPVEEYVQEVGPELEERSTNNDYNWASQLRAMIDHDISLEFGGSMEEAAKAVRADLFVIVAKQDHMVNPQPATTFAGLLNSRLLTLESDCGHRATGCEQDLLSREIASFLDQ